MRRLDSALAPLALCDAPACTAVVEPFTAVALLRREICRGAKRLKSRRWRPEQYKDIMNHSILTAPSPHAAQLLRPDEPVAGPARKDAPASVNGVGPAQGTSVALGDGLSREALHRDAQVARSAASDDDDDDDDVFYDAIDGVGQTAADAQVVETRSARDLAAAAAAADQDAAAGAQGILQDASENAGVMGSSLKAGTAARIVVEPDLVRQREADAAQVQQQQSAVLHWLGKIKELGGAVLGRAFGALDAMRQRPVLPASALPLTEVQTAREINFSRAEVLFREIDEELHKLNHEILREGHKPILAVDEDRPNGPQLSLGDHLSRYKHTFLGGTAALQTTVGHSAAVLATSAVASTVAPIFGPMGGLALQGAAVAGGAYTVLKSLREFPELASNHKVVGMIEEKLKQLEPKFDALEARMADERGRLDVESRIVMVGDARQQKMDALKHEISHVEKALAVAKARDTGVALGEGGARAATLGLAGRARAAFTAFFASLQGALDGVLRFFASLPLSTSGRAVAIQLEMEHRREQRSRLDALGKKTDASLMEGRLVTKARQRIAAAGQNFKFPVQHLLQGENLTRALLAQRQPSFGVLAYSSKDEPNHVHRIGASLTTARAMAWYLDTIADLPADMLQQSADTPQVRRHADDSLTVADPGRHLASFLMSVPVAYTAMMVDRQGQGLGVDAGLRIDDPSGQLPGGMHGLRFESVMDETWQKSALRMSFETQSARPVFAPLGNDAQMIKKLEAALHAASAPAAQPLHDYSNWAKERLEQRHAELAEQQFQESAAFGEDQRQLRAIDTWANP